MLKEMILTSAFLNLFKHFLYFLYSFSSYLNGIMDSEISFSAIFLLNRFTSCMNLRNRDKHTASKNVLTSETILFSEAANDYD